ncbi:hypothetical protein NQZ68_033457 [Dissostichus eleginoides]|nr:hypothetical protein NQZ68_033457 [Dissostichus eleginoides]
MCLEAAAAAEAHSAEGEAPLFSRAAKCLLGRRGARRNLSRAVKRHKVTTTTTRAGDKEPGIGWIHNMRDRNIKPNSECAGRGRTPGIGSSTGGNIHPSWNCDQRSVPGRGGRWCRSAAP